MRRTQEQKLFYYQQPGIYGKKIEELEETEVKVVRLLHDYPHYRNCDKCLIMGFWVLVDNFKGVLSSDIIHGLTPAESITRARRIIQNDLGLFLPDDPDIIMARGICESAVRNWSNKAALCIK